jgi:hypothetical protein
MYKTIEPDSWAQLASQGITNILPFRKSGGISEGDRRAFFQKTAASEKFLYEMDRIKLAGGDIPVHVNAIGASEYYGANRKGDAFSEKTCKECHPTFVTEGKNYIHHWNRDPGYNFGKIASSCYNDEMHRIELLVVTNGNEKAAKRNGGHVLPDEFLSKLEKNAEVAVSMGCRISYDVCSICGNKARTRAEYCDENTCRHLKTGEHYPGCKHGLMKVAQDGTIQHVDNIDPHFFDLSWVGLPADRTGYGFRADYLEGNRSKTASVHDPVHGPVHGLVQDKVFEDYLGVDKPTGFTAGYRLEMERMLQKLAAFEQQNNGLKDAAGNDLMAYGVYALRDNDIELGQKLAALSSEMRFDRLRYLAEQGVLLSPEGFAAAFSLPKTAAAEIRGSSRNIYTETAARYRSFDRDILAPVLAALDKRDYTKTAGYVLPDSLIRSAVLDEDRILNSVTGGTLLWLSSPKLASAEPQTYELAEAYALYKTAALCRFPAEKQDFGIRLAVWQTALHGSF